MATKEIDQEIIQRFEPLYKQAACGALSDWEDTANGALALVLVLDQFPRNMYRGTPAAFASDDLALEVVRRALARDFAKELPDLTRMFLYMPLMHSENLADQEICVRLFEAGGFGEKSLESAYEHLEAIKKFGRFPHRNAILGRTSSPEEEAYLAAQGGMGGY